MCQHKYCTQVAGMRESVGHPAGQASRRAAYRSCSICMRLHLPRCFELFVRAAHALCARIRASTVHGCELRKGAGRRTTTSRTPQSVMNASRIDASSMLPDLCQHAITSTVYFGPEGVRAHSSQRVASPGVAAPIPWAVLPASPYGLERIV